MVFVGVGVVVVGVCGEFGLNGGFVAGVCLVVGEDWRRRGLRDVEARLLEVDMRCAALTGPDCGILGI